MGRGKRVAQVGASRGMHPHLVTKKCADPRLVERDPTVDPVAETATDHIGEGHEGVRRLPVGPAASIL